MKLLFSTLILCFWQLGLSQTITGVVLDSVWQEPVPFAKITLIGSRQTTLSDINGNFTIKILQPTDTIKVNYVGYKAFFSTVSKSINQPIVIKLKPNTVLQEVEVIATKKNPAFEILKRINDNQRFNDPDKQDSYEFEVYNTMQFNLTNITEKFEDRKLIKNFDFIVNYMDSVDGNKYLPIIFTESLSNYYFKRLPEQRREDIKASRVTGFKIVQLDKYTGERFQRFNIYDNYIDVFNTDFMSPIALASRAFYDYRLVGRDTVDGEPCFKLEFSQKRKGDAVFNGQFWVTDSSYAIKKVKAKMPDDINLNYVSYFSIEQTYEQVNEMAWFVTNENIEVQFKVFNDIDKAFLMGVTAYKKTSRTNIKINTNRPVNFYVADVTLPDSISIKNNLQWDSIRHRSLTKEEHGIIDMVDSLEQNKTYKTYKNLAYLGYTGFWIQGPIEIGNIYSFYQQNSVEGHRLMLSARTSNNFSRWHEISAYGLYGFTDKVFKYGGSYRWKLKRPNREIFRIAYKKRVEQLSLSSSLGEIGNSFSTLLTVGAIDKLTLIDQYSIGFEKDWTIDMRTFNAIQWKKFTALQASDYRKFDGGDTTRILDLTSFEIRNQIMYTKEEKFISGSFERFSLGSKYPIISLTHTLGLKGVAGSEYTFNRLDFVWDHRPKIGVFGRLHYSIYAGKIFGTLPYPFLNIHEGNQTLYIQTSSMNLLNYYEFVSDTWIGFNFEHRLQGFVLDRVPLVRKLKLRLVYGAKAVVGSIEQKHQSEMLLPNYTYELSFTKPYTEASIGVENILKFIRVDAIWRLSYLNHTDITKFGVKFTFTGDF
ncbi:MAG: DUF5686 family protein [Putridiphycobacter sp.]|nr:DUF5686 family protein [Putridiphycobacter sp.]